MSPASGQPLLLNQPFPSTAAGAGTVVTTASEQPTAFPIILARMVHAEPGMYTRPVPFWSAARSADQIGSLPWSIRARARKTIRNANTRGLEITGRGFH